MGIVVDYIQCDKARKCNASRDQTEPEAFSDAVRDGCDRHSVHECAEVGRNVEQLGRERTVAVTLNDRRREVRWPSLCVSMERS